MLDEIIRTFNFKRFKAHVRQELNHAGRINYGERASITEIRPESSYPTRVYIKLYDFVKDSVIIEGLFIYNKVSFLANRGEELIIIAMPD